METVKFSFHSSVISQRMGSYLSQPVTSKETEQGELNGMGFACTAMQGWRTEMEDSHIILGNVGGNLDNVSMFAVFDGHGGREVARFCTNWLPKEAALLGNKQDLPGTMVRLYNRMDDLLRDQSNQAELKSYRPVAEGGTGPAPNARAMTMLQGSIQSDLEDLRRKEGQVSRDEATQVMMKMMFLRRLEQQVNAAASSSDSASSSSATEANIADSAGCTAVSVLVTPSQFIIANAGDSRALLCKAGHAIALSEDHKPNDPRERERIEKAGGTVEESQGGARTHYRVNGNLNLSRAIGDLEYKKNSTLKPEEQIITSTPDIVVIDRTKEDEFLTICCDGVYDVISNEELVAFIRERLVEGKALNQICEEIADECLSPDPKTTQGLGADNITCMIVDLRKRNSSE